MSKTLFLLSLHLGSKFQQVTSSNGFLVSKKLQKLRFHHHSAMLNCSHYRYLNLPVVSRSFLNHFESYYILVIQLLVLFHKLQALSAGRKVQQNMPRNKTLFNISIISRVFIQRAGDLLLKENT